MKEGLTCKKCELSTEAEDGFKCSVSGMYLSEKSSCGLDINKLLKVCKDVIDEIESRIEKIDEKVLKEI